MTAPSMKQVEEYLQKHGRRAANTMKLLGRHQPFIEAISSEIGMQLLQGDIDRHEELLTKLYEENITPQELAEFRYLKLRLKTVSAKITDYAKLNQEIISGARDEKRA